MKGAYQKGYSDALEGSDNPKDVVTLSSYVYEYRVGYVIGLCAKINASGDVWAVLAGELAAKLDVKLELLLPHIPAECREVFSRSYRETMAEIMEEFGE